jgi:glycolate oxidase FAD binding subunit
LSITPSDAPSLLAALRKQFEFRHFLDWAGGLVWLAVPAHVDANLIRNSMTSGHATLFRAPEAMRAHIDVFHPQPEALAALSLRVKQSFDPDQRLNPGRMYKGV